MKTPLRFLAMCSLLCSLGFASAHVASADTQGKVQPDPRKSCTGAKPHELCFAKPNDGVARAEYLSMPFYAVMLKTAPRCSIGETERVQVQALFPRSKVFSERFECDDNIEENISYTNVDPAFSFLAVHAGATLKEAKNRLAAVKATRRFPGATIRKMQAKLIYT